MNKEIEGAFYNDPVISDIDLEEIIILETNTCSTLWNKHVSNKATHFMLIEEGEWPARVCASNSVFNWERDWNSSNVRPFKRFLKQQKIPKDSVLYVFWNKSVGIKTRWEIFYSNWINFLYEDEGCILVFPNSNDAVILSNGNTWIGYKTQ